MSEKQKKMTWKEIKKNYPDEWVEIVNFDEDENGYVINGFVICHNKNKRKFGDLSRKILDKEKYSISASLYTGQHASLRSWEIENEK